MEPSCVGKRTDHGRSGSDSRRFSDWRKADVFARLQTMKISQLYLRDVKVGRSPAHLNNKLRVGIVRDCEL